ncbi:MAG: alpha-L-fucosidase [Phycisphaerae bacterium]|nr:alpha-L-fucosidase [Phycisphaerae bacterium]
MSPAFLKHKYGFFVHYWFGREREEACPEGLNKATDAFDAESFVRDVVSFGVEYVIFTIWHCNMNLLYPSKVMDRWRPGHTSRRDLVKELIEGFKGTGVNFHLYTHPADGHDFPEKEQAMLGWNGPAPYTKWNDFINEIYAEVMDRYGADVDTIIFDGIWPEQVDQARLRDTVLSRRPDAGLIALHHLPNTCCPYSTKELSWPDDEEYPWFGFHEYPPVIRSDADTWPSYQRMIAIPQGGNWNACGGSARYTAEMMYRYTVLQAATTSESPGVAWAAGPYPGGTWEFNVRERFQRLGLYVNAVAESIKNTSPSRSFITPEGSKIRNLPWGGVATRSLDGRYEYLHILNPPRDGKVQLPPPKDGRKFSSAVFLQTGLEVQLSENENGLVLTPPEGFWWRQLDNVFKLTAE